MMRSGPTGQGDGAGGAGRIPSACIGRSDNEIYQTIGRVLDQPLSVREEPSVGQMHHRRG